MISAARCILFNSDSVSHNLQSDDDPHACNKEWKQRRVPSTHWNLFGTRKARRASEIERDCPAERAVTPTAVVQAWSIHGGIIREISSA